MSAPRFEPGDVALRRGLGDTRWQRTTATRSAGCAQHHTRETHWHHADGGWDPIEDHSLSTYRPLVVIDPENRGAAIEIAQAVGSVLAQPGQDISRAIEAVQKHLRSLVTPPKPDEPQGLGAVVEDAEGRWWSRLGGTTEFHWHHGTQGVSDWANVAAVRVLSEGWSE